MMEDNVPGFPGYHVTRSGNVYSRRVERSPNKFRDWHLLKTTLKRNGRVKVVLYRSSKSYTLSLRRLDRLIKLGRSRIYIGKRLKVSRKTIYNSLHRG